MNEKHNQPNDEKLRSTLRDWKVTESLPPRFQEQVWNRIGRLESKKPAGSVALWPLLVQWLKSSITRPAFAVAYASVLLVIGLAGGFLRAQHENAKLDHMFETRYVQTIDPYQK